MPEPAPVQRFLDAHRFDTKELSPHCIVCRGDFTNWQRKYHCTMCGSVVCVLCMDIRAVTVQGRGQSKVCVCYGCTVTYERKYQRPNAKHAAGDDVMPDGTFEYCLRTMELMDCREFGRVEAIVNFYAGDGNQELVEKPVLTLDRVAPVDSWVLDVHRHQCVACARKFSTMLRKHHCRVCGEVVCKNCFQWKNAISLTTDKINVKVCKLCHLHYYFVS
ncbi:hypothetical protein ACHHYP_10900 [Achlya hypogyna]|uniref:FYVE-type domain-containing protein n=1 Tax=Achlya hypogyna TaxID=1202772 RepID=A0A1V9ZHN9_ACHHY|nr:hypothetical protein ACHHYP_10900 [Achlya hypogyna]